MEYAAILQNCSFELLPAGWAESLIANVICWKCVATQAWPICNSKARPVREKKNV